MIDSVAALTALGHPGRLAVFRLLARRAPQGVRPSEIAAALDLKPNTLSVYVGTLTDAGLVSTWREGRSVFYGVALDRVGDLVGFLVNDCCRGRPELCVPLAAHALARLDGVAPISVLFVCTGNSARSVFAEAILNDRGDGRFRAFSAGAQPARRVHPLAVATLQRHDHAVDMYSPIDLAAFREADAPRIDAAVTLCDRAANEDCPLLPGLPVSSHWGIPDPAQAGDEAAFEATYRAMESRLTRLVEASFPATPLDLQRLVDAIGTDAVAAQRNPTTSGRTR